MDIPTKRPSTSKSVAYAGMAQVCRVALMFVSAPLLGRLLDAADFGLVATAAPIFAFVTMVQQMGFNQAIVQRHVLSKGQTDALFWLSAGFSLTLAAALVLLSGPIAGFFREPRLAGLIQAGAVLVVVSVAASQPIALLSRELRFKTIAYLDMLGSILGTVLAVAAAWLTRSYWALLLPFAAASLVNFVGGAIGARWHPGRPVWDKATREMIGFGTHVSLFNIVNFLARNADNLMIAKAHGATALGFYDRAYRLMLLPLTQATMPMSRVLTPILSRLQNDPENYRRTYSDAVSFLMAAVQPGVLCAVIYSQTTVSLLLGPKWSDAAPIFAWLGVAGLHQIFSSSLGWLLISQARTRDLLFVGTVNAISTVLAFAVGLPWGGFGVAVAYVVSDYALRVPFTWYVIGRSGHVRSSDIWKIAFPHIVGLLAAAIALMLVKTRVGSPSLIEFFGLASTSYIVSWAVLALFPSKRVLFVEAFNVGRRRLASLAQRVKPC